MFHVKSYNDCKVPLLKPALVRVHLTFANDHLDDPVEERAKAMWSD